VTQTALAGRIPLDDYAAIVGAGEIQEMRTLAAALRGRGIQMINSTKMGGGVAEILNRLVPLAEELGLTIHWDVMQGSDEFFEVTKSFHNALHGGAYQSPAKDLDVFMACSERNYPLVRGDASFIVVHDPQPAALIQARKARSGHWIWRCHIDLSRPNQTVWEFLEGFVSRYDGALFSSPEFARRLPIPQYLFHPAIDPLAEKNRDLEDRAVAAVLERYQIDRRRPVLTQISRFDRLKDPVGVIRAYRIVKRYVDCQLVLAGGGASDDPEGAEVFAESLDEAQGDPDIHVLELPYDPVVINALQRGSTVILQKSLREGFGLTVAEALWKKKPVVASAVGGIPLQVIHKHTGLLAHSVEGTAYQVRFLLSHPEIAARLGEQGHQHVKENFLITQNLRNYLALFLVLDRGA